MKRGQWIECNISKLVFGGCGLAHHEGQAVFVHGALPDETVRAKIIKARRSHVEAIAQEIIVASRLKPLEEHYLSCSPWQILTQSEEMLWKQRIACETLKSIGNIEIDNIDLTDDTSRTGYRNKMEFSFCWSDDGLSLAFFERGSHRKVAIKGCVLADALINQTATCIVHLLRDEAVPETSLKSLVLRSSRQGEVIAGLFVTDKNLMQQFPNLETSLEKLGLKGIAIFYSDSQSPASVVNETLWECGSLLLEEHLETRQLSYGLHSFFQVNLNMFEQALQDMAPFVASQKIIDLYCGVGAIGVALSQHAKKICFVDSSPSSIHDLQQNLVNNQLQDADVICQPVEQALKVIDSDATVLVDPPRAGLHHKVLRHLCQTLPPQMIYLSCNLSTCSRDLGVLQQSYHITKIKCYNFFPMTPHFETLVILEKK